jgi:putative ABC transport system permease protein
MAWRDSRRYKGRMCLFVLSIAIGVAALVALGSFWINVKDAINDQARALLGADLQVQTRQELSLDDGVLSTQQRLAPGAGPCHAR